jgi:hypothetical protein
MTSHNLNLKSVGASHRDRPSRGALLGHCSTQAPERTQSPLSPGPASALITMDTAVDQDTRDRAPSIPAMCGIAMILQCFESIAELREALEVIASPCAESVVCEDITAVVGGATV